jgi:hypothetical protein
METPQKTNNSPISIYSAIGVYVLVSLFDKPLTSQMETSIHLWYVLLKILVLITFLFKAFQADKRGRVTLFALIGLSIAISAYAWYGSKNQSYERFTIGTDNVSEQ